MSELGSQVYLAFAAGLLSVLSPCVLPLMPAYLSLISGITVEEMQESDGDAVRAGARRRRVMRSCVGFVLGFSAVFIALGIGAVSVGHVVRTWSISVFGFEVGFAQLMGVVVVVLGLHIAGLTPIPALYRDTRVQLRVNQYGATASFVVGAAFALGWSPCIGPILATILGLAAVRDSVGEGALLLTIYSAGLAVPFLLAGWSLDAFFTGFARIKRHFRKLEVVSGMVLVGVGILLVTDRLSWLNTRFAFMNEWITSAERALQ
ncbi:MAG: cytochrome c biogenesis protein CcdA [Myxococcota bacterium]|jgi:cytochrome c-type biogenesis protein|nr:cytochrome C biogenesis protein [Deltaproteobacteria bacterium]MCP4244352.1 cytochrome c biogenesis protein CcdA [bacterium]MDP6074862.1 cytochrome c biogenesis protein CcdA [Myxococcota bacterium]MDP7075229.1 cytochrome c biogenesis protein CcdA [Myxococcota bacterium]MDP7300911.1 cytochrome c biogenesis protein CcdA [Myxococcota bacterium]